MMIMIAKIAEAELEVMRILWREMRPLSFTEIRTELENRKKADLKGQIISIIV